MRDLRGKTLAIVGAGNIGQNIARLAKAFGMQVLGCRRRPRVTPHVDEICGCADLKPMLARADIVAVAAPFVPDTDGMLGPDEFKAMRPGALYINVSRGAIAQESALLDSLRSGHLAGAGLDVFTAEPLPREHPFWSMPNVLVSPHYSGETVNLSAEPCRRFARNLHNWLGRHPIEGVVDLDLGY
jgi:phosphoglycerate dehydrogenase-like enzyme